MQAEPVGMEAKVKPVNNQTQSKRIPSREPTYTTRGKDNHLQKWLGRGFASSEEGMDSIDIFHRDNFGINVRDARKIVGLLIGDGQTSPSIWHPCFSTGLKPPTTLHTNWHLAPENGWFEDYHSFCLGGWGLFSWGELPVCFRDSTPWKINGWNLQITHEKKGKISEPNLQGIMFQPLIFQGVAMIPICLTT